MVERMQISSNPITFTQNNLLDYFAPANIRNSWHEEDTNVYNFVSCNSDKLLVTVGDSWTWGSDISEHNGDDDFRIKHVYGNVLREKLNYDWLNLALCAQSNQWMADRVSELEKIVCQLNYTKIDIIVVFTGAGRMFNTDQDRYFDYISYFKTINNFDTFLYDLNCKAVEQIKKIEKHSHINVYFSSNAVDHLGFTSNLLPWYKVLGFTEKFKCYTDMTAIDKLRQVPEFLSGNMNYKFKTWFLKQIDSASRRETIYNNETIFRNQHPLAEYHKQWANYLYKDLYT